MLLALGASYTELDMSKGQNELSKSRLLEVLCPTSTLDNNLLFLGSTVTPKTGSTVVELSRKLILSKRQRSSEQLDYHLYYPT
jgi:hypothetical protein